MNAFGRWGFSPTWLLLGLMGSSLWSPAPAKGASASPAGPTPVVWKSGMRKTPVLGSGYFEVLEDPTGDLSLEDVRGSDQFEVTTSPVLSYGFTRSVFWFRTTIVNASLETQPVIFHFKNPFYDSLRLYVLGKSGEVVQRWDLGDHQPYGTRPILTNNFPVPLKLRPGSTTEVYVRLTTSELFWVAPVLQSPEEFVETETTAYGINGLLYGVILVMVLYNFLLFLVTFDLIYISYSVYLLVHALFLASFKAFGFETLWGDYPKWNAISFNVLGWLMIAMLMVFLRCYLDTKKLLPTLDRIMKLVVAFSLSMILLTFNLDPVLMSQLSGIVWIFLSALLIYAGYRGYRERVPFVGFFNLAFSFVVVSYLMQLCVALMPEAWPQWVHAFFMDYGLEAAVCVEATLLSIGVGYRLTVFRDEAADLQRQNLKFEESARAELEEEVERQTRELTETLENLEATQGLLAQQARLATVGNLVSGMAHEIGNPLTLTLGGAERLQELLEEAIGRGGELGEEGIADANACAILVLKGSHRIEEIVRNLNQLAATGQSPNRHSCDVRETVTATLEILQQQLSTSAVVIETHVPSDLRVHANSGELAQVLLNLVLNAVQAMGGEGTLDIRAEVLEEEVVIEIVDNGPGIPPETREQIFDAFFTTKQQGEGTGLGLSISHQIIRDSGGTLTLEPSDTGAHFRLTLPVESNGAQ